MKDNSKFEDMISKDLDVRASDRTYNRMRDAVLDAHGQSKQKPSAARLTIARRTIMKSPIVKLAVAAAVIAVVVLGLVEFIGTGSKSKSGVVWAEVAKKVEASRGVIFRSRDTAPDSRDGGPDYTMNYLSFTQARFDSYKGDQIIKTFYDDFNTKTVVFIDHGHKSYIKKTFEQMDRNDLLRDPKSLIQKFLSHKHRELGRKTIEGVLCEGIETTDPTFDEANFPVDSLMARVWVSVETGYPVLLEVEVTRSIGDNQKVQIKAVVDQFQWDVELDESMFEPNIPADYMEIEMP